MTTHAILSNSGEANKQSRRDDDVQHDRENQFAASVRVSIEKIGDPTDESANALEGRGASDGVQPFWRYRKLRLPRTHWSEVVAAGIRICERSSGRRPTTRA
jgi:hypothetical protein